MCKSLQIINLLEICAVTPAQQINQISQLTIQLERSTS